MCFQDRIIYWVKSKYWRTSHNFGIQFPKTVQYASNIEWQFETDFWTKSTSNKMENFCILLEKLDIITSNDMIKETFRSVY